MIWLSYLYRLIVPVAVRSPIRYDSRGIINPLQYPDPTMSTSTSSPLRIIASLNRIPESYIL